MGIVHHANYLRYCEEARVQWLEENDQPYLWYVEHDLHFAVTRVELDYHASARFYDRLEIKTWVEAIRGASPRAANTALASSAKLRAVPVPTLNSPHTAGWSCSQSITASASSTQTKSRC